MYDSYCPSQTHRFELAGVPCITFHSELLDNVESIGMYRATSFKEKPLEADLLE